MLDLPEVALEDVSSLADWVELNTLASPAGVFSANDAADVLHDAGNWGLQREDVFSDDVSFSDEDTFSEDEDVERVSEIVWTELKRRSTELGRKYSFRVDGDILRRDRETPEDIAGAAVLLLCDIGRKYSLKAGGSEGAKARLFEKVVEAAMAGLFGGASCRFGWPIEDGWPTAIDDRIKKLADLIGLQTEDLTEKTRVTDKDRGLDVVAGHYLGDGDPGTVYFLAQCAIGNNWKSKRGEPSLAEWQDVLRWNSRLIRVVALPWRLDGSFDRKRAYRYFDAVILDRERLLFGEPDRRLEGAERSRAWKWCESLLKKIPVLK